MSKGSFKCIFSISVGAKNQAYSNKTLTTTTNPTLTLTQRPIRPSKSTTTMKEEPTVFPTTDPAMHSTIESTIPTTTKSTTTTTTTTISKEVEE